MVPGTGSCDCDQSRSELLQMFPAQHASDMFRPWFLLLKLRWSSPSFLIVNPIFNIIYPDHSGSTMARLCSFMMVMEVAAIRESLWEATTDWSVPDAACQEVKCLKAPSSDATRINQARYQILAVHAQKVAWKLPYGAKYSVQQSPECSDDLTKLSGQAHVAQWVDKTNPINNSVVEVFLDPLQELHIRSDPRQHFLCSSDSRGQRCLCQLDSTASPNLGLLARLGRIVPTSFRLTEVQVLMERTCPASWIPDFLVSLMCFRDAAVFR